MYERTVPTSWSDGAQATPARVIYHDARSDSGNGMWNSSALRTVMVSRNRGHLRAAYAFQPAVSSAATLSGSNLVATHGGYQSLRSVYLLPEPAGTRSTKSAERPFRSCIFLRPP